jgi:hypothetical protein
MTYVSKELLEKYCQGQLEDSANRAADWNSTKYADGYDNAMLEILDQIELGTFSSPTPPQGDLREVLREIERLGHNSHHGRGYTLADIAEKALANDGGGWRPIETAPKNRNIWLADYSSMRVGFWLDGKQHECRGSVGGGWKDHALSGQWSAPRDLWFTPLFWKPVPTLPTPKIEESE